MDRRFFHRTKLDRSVRDAASGAALLRLIGGTHFGGFLHGILRNLDQALLVAEDLPGAVANSIVDCTMVLLTYDCIGGTIAQARDQ